MYKSIFSLTKNILLVIFTHGNEKIGVQTLAILKQRGLEDFFDCLIANPKAAKANKRFLEKDLNRSYPGKKNSQFYEERKAYRNLKIVKRYEFVIDLHEAPEGKDDFIIIPRERASHIFPLNRLALSDVILWPEPKGPLGDVLGNVVELEFGSKNRDREKMAQKAADVLEGFFLEKSFPEKTFYYVFGFLKGDEAEARGLNDFELTKRNNEEFYPLLANQYLNLGIACYKARKLSRNEAF